MTVDYSNYSVEFSRGLPEWLNPGGFSGWWDGVRPPAERAIVTAINGQVNAVRPMGRPRKRWSDKVREVLNAWE